MFRLLCKELLQCRARDAATIIHISFLQTPFVAGIVTITTTTGQQQQQQQQQPSSLTVSYLVNACRLSPETALAAAEQIQIKTTKNPDSVLRLLGDYGFTVAHISTIVAKRPMLLLMKSDKTLRPKLDFLRGVGFSGPNIADLLCVNPDLLRRSLEKKIVPSFNFLKNILPAGASITDALKFSTRMNLKDQLPNIECLRSHGVPDAVISKLLVTRPGSLMRSPGRFEEIVTTVKEMGQDPESPMFAHAVGVMSFMCRSTWERKMAAYRSWGWSDDEISTLFRKQPTTLGLSDERIQRKMEFFTKKLGWGPGIICRSPILMLLNLENRTAPRCSVLNVLMSRGKIKRKTTVCTELVTPEKDFLEKYVTKYAVEVPEVVEAHQGKVEFVGWV